MEENRIALAGQLPHKPKNLALGADVNAARRIEEKQDACLGKQHLAENHLLLIAAGQGADRLVGCVCFDAQERHHLIDQRLFLSGIENAIGGEPRDDREGEVLADAFWQKEPLAAAVFGDECQTLTSRQCLSRGPRCLSPAPDFDRTLCFADPEEALEQLALAVALKTAYAKHL